MIRRLDAPILLDVPERVSVIELVTPDSACGCEAYVGYRHDRFPAEPTVAFNPCEDHDLEWAQNAFIASTEFPSGRPAGELIDNLMNGRPFFAS